MYRFMTLNAILALTCWAVPLAVPLDAWDGDAAPKFAEVSLSVVDFRKQQPRRYWVMSVRGTLDGKPWSGGLKVSLADGRHRKMVGRIPSGVTNLVLDFRTPRGHAVTLEQADSGIRRSGEVVPVNDLGNGLRGKLSFYDAAYVLLNVKDEQGGDVTDAKVTATVRSAAIAQFEAEFKPLAGKPGHYRSPALIGPFAFVDVTVEHSELGVKRVAVGDLQRNETKNATVILGVEDPNPIPEPAQMPILVKSEELLSGRELKDAERELTFGKSVEGLAAAMMLSPSQAEYAAGSRLDVKVVIRNVADEPVQFSTALTLSNIARLLAVDSDGRKIDRVHGRFLGGRLAGHVHYRLAPGHCAILPTKPIRLGNPPAERRFDESVLRVLGGEICKLKLEIPLPGVQIRGGRGRLLVPAIGEFVGTLRTGVVEVKVLEASSE